MSVACDVYTKLMFQRGLGHPLWEPEPTKDGEVLIGDVGYILDGGFYRLFNAVRSSDDTVNIRNGVPDNFEPFTIPDTIHHRREQALPAKPIYSKNIKSLKVRLGGGIEANLGTFGASGHTQVKLGDNQSAILALKHPADREVLHPCKDLTQYILQNHTSWHEFAQNTFKLDIEADDILFVTGWIKTAEWALAAATQHSRDIDISFGVDIAPVFNISFDVSSGKNVATWWEHRSGPETTGTLNKKGEADDSEELEATPGPPVLDQCIFIRYCKVKYRKFMAPKVIKVKAGDPQLDDDESSAEGDSLGVVSESVVIDEAASAESSMIEADVIPGMRSDQSDNLVECILDYILNNTGARCAIASDLDLLSLTLYDKQPLQGRQGDQFELEDCEISENVSQFLDKLRPSISVIDGVGMFSWHNTSESPHAPNPSPLQSRGTSTSWERYLGLHRPRSCSPTSRTVSSPHKSPTPPYFSSPAGSLLQHVEGTDPAHSDPVMAAWAQVGAGTDKGMKTPPNNLKRKRKDAPDETKTASGSQSSGSRYSKRLRQNIYRGQPSSSPLPPPRKPESQRPRRW